MSDQSPEELRRTFDDFDSNASGAIDEDEFVALSKKLGIVLGEGELHTAFLAIDVNGNRRIDYGEFASWYKRVKK